MTYRPATEAERLEALAADTKHPDIACWAAQRLAYTRTQAERTAEVEAWWSAKLTRAAQANMVRNLFWNDEDEMQHANEPVPDDTPTATAPMPLTALRTPGYGRLR